MKARYVYAVHQLAPGLSGVVRLNPSARYRVGTAVCREPRWRIASSGTVLAVTCRRCLVISGAIPRPPA